MIPLSMVYVPVKHGLTGATPVIHPEYIALWCNGCTRDFESFRNRPIRFGATLKGLICTL